ncbi:hypothetical protein GGH92_010647, partial [Coemansia sp. RSA 2673]
PRAVASYFAYYTRGRLVNTIPARQHPATVAPKYGGWLLGRARESEDIASQCAMWLSWARSFNVGSCMSCYWAYLWQSLRG